MFIGVMEGAALFILIGFALACAAIARACFSPRPDGTATRTALLWSAAFVAQVLGAIMVRDAIGAAAPLTWSVTVLVAAGAGTLVLGRLWRERAMEREAMRMRLLVLQPDRDRLRDEELGRAPAHDGERSGGVEASGPAYDECGLTARCAWAARVFDLTRREEDVLVLLATGRTASEVASELVVSPNTVKTHIRNLYRKLGINRRGDLAERLGLERQDGPPLAGSGAVGDKNEKISLAMLRG